MLFRSPMPSALETAVVTARQEQVPRTRRRTGFSLMMPLVRMLTLDLFSDAISYQPPLCQLVVAVDAVVDGGEQRLRGNGRAAVCVKTALTDGDILGAVHAVELCKEGVVSSGANCNASEEAFSRPISINLPSARFISLITSPLPGCQASEISSKFPLFSILTPLSTLPHFREITAPTEASSISVIANSAVLATVTMDV